MGVIGSYRFSLNIIIILTQCTFDSSEVGSSHFIFGAVHKLRHAFCFVQNDPFPCHNLSHSDHHQNIMSHIDYPLRIPSRSPSVL